MILLLLLLVLYCTLARSGEEQVNKTKQIHLTTIQKNQPKKWNNKCNGIVKIACSEKYIFPSFRPTESEVDFLSIGSLLGLSHQAS